MGARGFDMWLVLHLPSLKGHDRLGANIVLDYLQHGRNTGATKSPLWW